MSYDRLDWHLDDADELLELRMEGDDELHAARAEELAASHIGAFIRWAGQHGLLDASLFPTELRRLNAGEISGTDFLRDCLDEKLTEADFTPEGNAFAGAYYQHLYFDDYYEVCEPGLLESELDLNPLNARLDERLRQFVANELPRATPWWRRVLRAFGFRSDSGPKTF
ncbi:MAG: hypothetical protein AAF411_30910 [Myxococcota bacterium]